MTKRSSLIAQMRGQLWYHHVRHVSGLTQRALDCVVEDLDFDAKNDHAKWRFKRLRERRSDPHKISTDRPWSLVDRVAERLSVCEASRALYHSDLWDWLLGNVPRLEVLHERIERELGERGFFRPTADQVRLFGALIPESTRFIWTAEYALEGVFRPWGDSISDLTLAAGLALEASLAGNWNVVGRWDEPLRRHIERFKSQLWLRTEDAQNEAQQLGEQIIGVLLESPKGASKSVDRSIFEITSSPIVSLHGDAVWFLKWEPELYAAYHNRTIQEILSGGGDLDMLLAKRAEYAIKKRKGAIYMDFHRRDRR